MLPECSQAFPSPVISLHKFICLGCNQMENRRKTMKKANKDKTYQQNTIKRNRPCPQQRTSRTPRCRCPASLVTEHHFLSFVFLLVFSFFVNSFSFAFLTTAFNNISKVLWSISPQLCWIGVFVLCKYENFYAPFPQLQIKFNWIVTNPTILVQTD